MFRPVLFAVAVIALVAPSQAAPDLSGNWILTTMTQTGESSVCILKIDDKGGKPSASIVFAPVNVEATVSSFRATDSGVFVTVKQTRMIQGRPSSTELSFIGAPGKDPKVIHGSTGTNTARSRAKLVATDKKALGADELVVRTPVPEPMTKILQMNTKAGQAQSKLLAEKDPEKKKDLQKDFTEAVRELNEKSPELYREVVEKHADSPAAIDASLTVLRGAARTKMTAADATKFVKFLQEKGNPFGPAFVGVSLASVADSLLTQPGLEKTVLEAIEPSAKVMTDDYPLAMQSLVLSAYRNALAKAGKPAEANVVAERVAVVEGRLDTEYLKAVPPFKPTSFAGRKDAKANQVAVLELFTGVQCPPCVAADVAFDAVQKAYKPTDVVLLQYHVHIPGPDPLTNADTVARQRYYGVNSAPSSFFNGTRGGGSGGAMAASERKFGEYQEVINPLLEKTTPVKLAGKAIRNGDKLDITVEAANGDGEDMKLRLLVVEENVKFVGGNGVRFHHHVVRAMPGGVEGVAIKDKSFRHTAAIDLGEVRKGMTKYLDDFVASNPTRPFARPDRPMEMKAVKVVALVQNDKTKEIAQAIQIEVEGRAAGGGGGR